MLPSPPQDLGDLAEVVLAKLQQTGIKDAHPIVLQFHAKLVHGRTCDETTMKVERVWLNGAVHWLLHDEDPYSNIGKASKAQPVIKEPRTAVRFVLGRARQLSPTGSASIDWKVDLQLRVCAGSVRSVLWSTRVKYRSLMNSSDALETELEIVRIFEELARVRVMPV